MNRQEKEVLANQRNKLLWDYYNNNNGVLTNKDCKRLTGATNIKALMKTFETYNLPIPDRWDESKVRVRRNADNLNAMAKEKDVSELTTEEMAEAIGRPISSVHYMRQECKRHGLAIPGLYIKQEWRRKMIAKRNVKKDDNFDIIEEDAEMQPEYAEGLPVLLKYSRPDPDDPRQMIYMLR